MRKLLLLSFILSAGAAFGQKSYQRTLTVTDPCSGVGIAESISEGFEVFPNPSNGVLNFVLPQTGTAILTDLNGAIVRQQNAELNNQWDLGQLSNGVYFLSLYTDSKLFRTKLILAK